MTSNAFLQIVFYLSVLTLLAKPLGVYIARVFSGKSCGLDLVLSPVEKFFYRFAGVKKDEEMNWINYTLALLLFNFLGFFAVYLLQVFQHHFPLNPSQLGPVAPDLSFNTAVSFMTNTNWQAYSGEVTLSYLTQMLGLAVQNFVSAATGMAVAIALIRGLARRESTALGNFWVDLVRGVLYILLPLATILALLLVSQGVLQNFMPTQKISVFQSTTYTQPVVAGSDVAPSQTPEKIVISEQSLPNGPMASQIAIKQLGTNGGGFLGANSAHPFENPTPLSNFLEMLALLLIPAAFCFAFGSMVNDKRQGLAIFLAMTIIFIPFLFLGVHAEQNGNQLLNNLSIDQTVHAKIYPAPGGNMEGKETRFGITNSALWAASTTAVSNGSVNASLDSFTPLGGMVPMVLMQLGETVYGGVGSGLYGMLVFIILTVFIAGLMVGRTPEYLGKKIEVFEMKMASLSILVPHFLILLFTAFAVSTATGRASISNPAEHGFSEVLYAFTSTAMNNGSAFAGLNTNTPFYNIFCGIAMLCGRFWLIVPVLAIAGSLARKKLVPTTTGTMPTHTPLFIGLVIGIVLIIGALTFFPSLALGPIVEHLIMVGH